MPELAEVEFYRKCWNCGLHDQITGAIINGEKRVFRTVDVQQLQRSMPGTVLLHSEAKGKQLLFRFSNDLWLGLHLGMTGKLQTGAPEFIPGKHDHLVLYQKQRALVFTDPRLFGRVRFQQGSGVPDWWAHLPAPITSKSYRPAHMQDFLRRHGKLPIKAALLHQTGFPGIGNWMADEILWRAQLDPSISAGHLTPAQRAALWKSLRFVCRGALRHVGKDFSDPPSGWLFHERWHRNGRCPIHGSFLVRAKVAGRTTAWCRTCQPA